MIANRRFCLTLKFLEREREFDLYSILTLDHLFVNAFCILEFILLLRISDSDVRSASSWRVSGVDGPLSGLDSFDDASGIQCVVHTV